MGIFVFIASCLVFTSASLSVILRLYSRKLTKTGIDWDDGLIVVSAATVVALFGLSIFLWAPGWSRDSLRDLGYSSHTILSLLLLFEVLHLTAMCLAKLSALYLYARIFIQDGFRSICKYAGATVIIVYIGMLVETITISDIAVALWKNSFIGGPAIMQAADITISVLNILGNLAILIMPIPPIWKLQMKIKTKINLTILFCLGICVSVVSCARLSLVIHQNYDADTLISYGSRDMHLNVLEPELAILCLCLPILRPLWIKLGEKICAARGQSCVDQKPNIAAATSREKEDDGSLVSWKDVIAGDSSKYDVYIHGGPSGQPVTRSGRSPYRQRLMKPKFAVSPHRQPKQPGLPHIKVDKSWSVSYETASLMH